MRSVSWCDGQMRYTSSDPTHIQLDIGVLHVWSEHFGAFFMIFSDIFHIILNVISHYRSIQTRNPIIKYRRKIVACSKSLNKVGRSLIPHQVIVCNNIFMYFLFSLIFEQDLKLRNILSDLQSVFFEFTSQAPAIKTEAFCLDLYISKHLRPSVLIFTLVLELIHLGYLFQWQFYILIKNYCALFSPLFLPSILYHILTVSNTARMGEACLNCKENV